MDDNNNLTPSSVGEEKEFSVTENNSWDAHQDSFGHTEELAQGAFSELQGQPQNGYGAPNMQGNMTPPMGAAGPQPGMTPPPGAIPQPGMTPPPGPIPQPGMTPPPGVVPPQGYMAPPQPGSMMQPPFAPAKDMSVKDWFLTLLLSYIPIVGLVMQIIWAAEKPDKPEFSCRKNWAIASLIWTVIKYVLGTVLYFIIMFGIVEFLDYFF